METLLEPWSIEAGSASGKVKQMHWCNILANPSHGRYFLRESKLPPFLLAAVDRVCRLNRKCHTCSCSVPSQALWLAAQERAGPDVLPGPRDGKSQESSTKNNIRAGSESVCSDQSCQCCDSSRVRSHWWTWLLKINLPSPLSRASKQTGFASLVVFVLVFLIVTSSELLMFRILDVSNSVICCTGASARKVWTGVRVDAFNTLASSTCGSTCGSTIRGSTHLCLHTPVALRLSRLSYRRAPICGLATCGVMKTDCREVLEEFLLILCCSFLCNAGSPHLLRLSETAWCRRLRSRSFLLDRDAYPLYTTAPQNQLAGLRLVRA